MVDEQPGHGRFILIGSNQPALGAGVSLSFYRDSSGREVDVILEQNRVPHAIEIKASRTFSPDLARTLGEFAKLVPDTAAAHLIYGGSDRANPTGYRVLPFSAAAEIVAPLNRAADQTE